MDLLPDFGTWLLRSVRRTDNLSDSPVSVVERLNSLPRPLRNADKDTLVGAVLTLGPSLQLALHMLLELLPEDESRGRLGEVLCPTLGQLQKSLEETLACFEPKRLIAYNLNTSGSQPRVKTPTPTTQSSLGQDLKASHGETRNIIQSALADNKTIVRPLTPIRPEEKLQPPPQQPPQEPPQSILISPAKPSSPPRVPDTDDTTLVEKFPSFQQDNAITGSRSQTGNNFQIQDTNPHHGPYQRPSTGRSNPAADLALMKELRAEMRVNAAIQVAVDSLEFADGQMKIVRDVHRLHGGGSFELLQRHFYEGYNRILFRALELEQREFDSPDGSVAGEGMLDSPERGGGEESGAKMWNLAVGNDAGPENGNERWMTSSPTKLEPTIEESDSSAASPPRRPQRLSITQAPNVTPEHINTHREPQYQDTSSGQYLQPPPRLISFNNSQSHPNLTQPDSHQLAVTLPPLPPLSYPQPTSIIHTSPTRPRTAITGMRTRWEDQEPGHGTAVNGVNSHNHTHGHERRPSGRRNTVHGHGFGTTLNTRMTSADTAIPPVNGNGNGIPTRPKASLKRRLSLAEELALVGEESETEGETGDEGGQGWNGMAAAAAADEQVRHGGSTSDSSVGRDGSDEDEDEDSDESSEEDGDSERGGEGEDGGREDSEDDEDEESDDSESSEEDVTRTTCRSRAGVVAATKTPSRMNGGAAAGVGSVTVPRGGRTGSNAHGVVDMDTRRNSPGVSPQPSSRLPRPQTQAQRAVAGR